MMPRGRPRPIAVRVLLWLLGGLSALFAVIALFALFAPMPQLRTSLRDLHGAYHVHSNRSDGFGSPEAIAHAAHQAGLSFVVLTDHNREELPPPVYREGVLLISAVEMTTPAGHLVALGLRRGLNGSERQDGAIGRVLALGGVPVIAHPVQNRLPWADWQSAAHAIGFELYSGDTLFRRALEHPFTGLFPALAAYLGKPAQGIAALMGGDAESTARLLELSSQPGGPRVVFCGLDAHGYPPYGAVFAVQSMHLSLPGDTLPADPVEAAALVVRALASGESYCALDGVAPAPGFRIEGLRPGTRVANVNARLKPVFPGGAPPTWRWQGTGPVHVEPDGHTLVTDGPGMVQAEIWVRMPGLFLIPVWRPWIVPSPFEVRAP